MAYLEQFGERERTLLLSLPYRAGLFIGEADKAGGKDASSAEQQALQSIVTGFVEDFCKSEFVEELMRGTLAMKNEWPGWHKNVQYVPDDCRKAINFLSKKLEAKEVMAFKANLIEIGMAVAMAYCEYGDDTPWHEKFMMHSRFYYERWQAKRNKQPSLTLTESLNISVVEQRAIKALSNALQPWRVEGLPPAQAA